MVKVFQWFEGLVKELKSYIREPVDDFKNWFDTNFSDRLRFGILDTIEDIETEAVALASPLIDNVLEMKAIPKPIRSYFEKLKKQFAPIQLVALVPFLIGATLWAMAGAFSGWFEQVRQESMKAFKPSLLSPTDSILSKWRGKFTEARMKDELYQAGYNDERISALEEINKFIPPINDLIRFQVRDVFRETIVKQYKYDEGFKDIEAALKPWAEKLGVETDTLKLYWRAHWELPSLTSAFEMFHRGLMTEAELKDLITINDMAPAYVDKLVKIAYSPYTRVDVRRMYDAGVINRQQVKRAYLDIGYDEEHAENLTKWTEKDVLGEDLNLNKSEILNLYEQGSLTRAKAVTELQKLGYDAEESELILKLEDNKTEQKLKDRDKKVISNQFYYNQISRQEAEAALNKLGISEREKNLTLSEVEARIREKVKLPARTDLEKWYGAGLINENEFRAEMAGLGYAEKYIENYLAVLQAEE